jgi:DNA-binding Xre family transcriptional regulator
MLTIEEVASRLQNVNLSEVSREIDLSRVTLIKLKHGKTKNCHYDTLRKLSDYFEGGW